MSQRSLEEFGAYRKARELFDLVDGRLSRAEYVHFHDFARGSAREKRGRYLRMTTWLGEDVIRQRTALADEIVGILTATIERLRSLPSPATTGRIREEAIEYVH